MKVAIIHYWLVGMRGGEKVIEALCEMYPQADIFTHVYAPEMVSDKIKQHRIIPTFINALPRATRMYKSYLPLMPLALEQIDLRGYDLVISSESGPAKGVIPSSDALHICYCHTPMRYIWNMYHDYRNGAGRLTRMMMPPLSHYLRMWDVTSAARVDSFVANSATVARRIRRYYRAESVVIHPPVDTDAFSVAPPAEVGDYYLMVGELVSYKRADLAVRAFNEMKLKLVVIVFVDGAYGLIRFQQLSGTGRTFATDLVPVDVAALADAVGARHVRLEGDAEATLRDAVAFDGVTIVEVAVGDSLSPRNSAAPMAPNTLSPLTITAAWLAAVNCCANV